MRRDYSFHKHHQHAFCVFGGDQPQPVRIRFAPKVAEMIREVCWHRSQKISDDPAQPGGIIFEVEVAYPQEVVWWMRQWGADAEVLEPPEMREYAREIAQREVEMYERREKKGGPN